MYVQQCVHSHVNFQIIFFKRKIVWGTKGLQIRAHQDFTYLHTFSRRCFTVLVKRECIFWAQVCIFLKRHQSCTSIFVAKQILRTNIRFVIATPG